MGAVAIELAGLTVRYGEVTALDRLDLVVPPGRVTAVVGPSGSGKSTLLLAVCGLLAPDAGDVRFDGRSVAALPPEKRDVGVVFQSYALFPHLSVAENVGFGLAVRGVGKREIAERVAAVLARLDISRLAARHPQELSGGEQQRVALARALAFGPRALLLDEPLSALDARLRLALRSELAERLAAEGVTVLYVTHDQEEAMALGETVAVLRAGRLEQAGSPEELYRRPATPFVASFVGEANFLPVAWDPDARNLAGPLGSWRVAAAEAASWNGRRAGRLLVRPESFREAGEEAADLVGRVLRTSFLGDRRRLAVEAAGIELAVDLPAATRVTVGSTLPLAIDFAATVLLPEFDPAELAPRGPAGAIHDAEEETR